MLHIYTILFLKKLTYIYLLDFAATLYFVVYE